MCLVVLLFYFAGAVEADSLNLFSAIVQVCSCDQPEAIISRYESVSNDLG